MNDILIFWNYLNEEFDDVEEFLEDYDFSMLTFEEENLEYLTEEEIVEIFHDMINLHMDLSSNDNYGDTYETLKEIGVSREMLQAICD